VDDTYIRLTAQDNRSMRETAFRVLEEEQEQEAIKRLERAARREEVRREQEEREANSAMAELEQSDTSQAPPEVLPENLDPEMVGRLKAIISAYDRANTDEAEGAPPAAPTGGAATTTY
jgi:hypothetical protein